MKTCPSCNLNKDLSEFYRRAYGGHSTKCISCEKEYRKQHYLQNKRLYLEKARRNEKNYIERNRDFLWEYLSDKECIDCGENDPIVLQFDHIKGEKLKAISDLVRLGFSLEKLNTEIKKCEVRCANCHLRKTSQDFKHWKWSRSSTE